MASSTMEHATKWAELCDQIPVLMEEHGVPGVAVGLIIGGQTYQQGFGVTSLTNPLPITTETIFQIGSITKTVTGTALMRLVEAGQVDLGAPVRHYLPDFQVADESAAAAVTLTHLLTHTAGWEGDFILDTGAGDDALARYVAAMASLPQQTPVGEIFAYNNAALNVAGRIIEVVTGKSYEAAIRELVLAPLGLDASFFFPGEVMVRRFAVGHIQAKGETTVAEPWNLPRSLTPCGGLCCTITDLLRYGRFHLGDGSTEAGAPLLSPAAMRQMQTPVVEAVGGTQMGLTWGISTANDVRFLSHTGGTFGQASLLWLVPEQGIALAVLANHNDAAALIGQISSWVRREYLGVTPRERPTPIALPIEALRGFEGRYANLDAQVTLQIEGERLMLRYEELQQPEFAGELDALPPMEAAPIPGDRLMVMEGPLKGAQIEFLTTKDGRRWIRALSRLFVRHG